MKKRLQVLHLPSSDIEYERNIPALINHMFPSEDSIMNDLDKTDSLLLQSKRILMLHNLVKQHGTDKGLEALVGPDNLEFASSDEGLKEMWNRLGDGMDTFAKKISKLISTKTVSEKYIGSRFEKLKSRLGEAGVERAIVRKVPTYEEATKRFVGAMNVANFLEDLSTKDPGDIAFQDTLFNKVEAMSNGVLKINKPKKGTGIRNLVWNPPTLTEYDVMASPWNKQQSREQMRNLIIGCKYQGADNFKKAAKAIKQTTQKQIIVSAHSDGTTTFDDGSGNSGYESYDYENDYSDVSSSNRGAEHTAHLKAYSAIYLLTKICKQAHQNAIEKEINMFCITFIHRLCSYEFV